MKLNKTTYRILFLIYLAVVLFLCFGHFRSLPQAPREFFGLEADKIVHFLMFLPFPVLAYLAFSRPSHKARHSLLLAVCILAAGAVFAAGTELIQGLIPYREADNSDFLADFLALCLSAVVIFAIDLNKNRHA